MRYFIALIVAVVVLSVGVMFTRQTFNSYEVHVRTTLRRQREAGTLPRELRGVDVETVDVWCLGGAVRLTPFQENCLQAALLLYDLWYFFGPLTLVVCFGVARLARRQQPL